MEKLINLFGIELSLGEVFGITASVLAIFLVVRITLFKKTKINKNVKQSKINAGGDVVAGDNTKINER